MVGGHTTEAEPSPTKEQRRYQTNVLAYRPATSVTEPKPTKGTEASSEQRPCLSARYHSDNPRRPNEKKRD